MKSALNLQMLGVEGISLLQFSPYARAMDMIKPGERFRVTDLPESIGGVPGSTWTVNGEVRGEEEVTTPAGKFRAWNVRLSGVAPRVVQGMQQFYQFTLNVWFAPEAKRFVRLAFESTGESGRGNRTVNRDLYELVQAPR